MENLTLIARVKNECAENMGNSNSCSKGNF